MHNGECGDICMHKSGEIYPLFQFSPLRLRDNQRSPLCPAVCSPWKSFCISVFLSCSELAQRTLQSGAQTVNTIRTEFAISDFHRCGGASLYLTTKDHKYCHSGKYVNSIALFLFNHLPWFIYIFKLLI